MSSGHIFTCKHNRTSSEPCDDCLIFWHERGIESARKDIAKHERKIAELRAKLPAPILSDRRGRT